ncbi:acyl transferase/acyl hydrolase/lysophospholipase [Cladochytrium replicatum]|nr:acyl transferase/acyl hydrolase/lysophospholipase [Cladochytrium replicatum]
MSPSRSLYFLFGETLAYWRDYAHEYFSRKRREEMLMDLIVTAPSYKEWKEAAEELDEMLSNNAWKQIPESADYDHSLIDFRLRKLRQLREANKIDQAMYLLTSGFLRNIGGLGDPRLYSKCYIGTKALIEGYLDEVLKQLLMIRDSPIPNTEKSGFLNDKRISFGSTALILHGGATFGLFHLGVIKALCEARLLPRVISGSSVGALIAALVCISKDEDLTDVLVPEHINLEAFSKKRVTSRRAFRKLARWMKHGHLMDVKVLEDCVRTNVGDLTFEDAYKLTNRVLNITVSSSRKHEVPRLLNYLTAPNVLIWSAACASAAATGLYQSVHLLARDKDGNIVRWSPSTIKWSDSTFAIEGESPEIRLAELFNVNQFILSQASPFIAPFVPRDIAGSLGARRIIRRSAKTGILAKVVTFVSSEISFRMSQFAQLGILPKMFRRIFDQTFQPHITISPTLSSWDYYTIFSNPTHATLKYWLLKGEQATWPFLSLIRCRTEIEYCLDDVLRDVRDGIDKTSQQQSYYYYHSHPFAGMQESEANGVNG